IIWKRKGAKAQRREERFGGRGVHGRHPPSWSRQSTAPLAEDLFASSRLCAFAFPIRPATGVSSSSPPLRVRRGVAGEHGLGAPVPVLPRRPLRRRGGRLRPLPDSASRRLLRGERRLLDLRLPLGGAARRDRGARATCSEPPARPDC